MRQVLSAFARFKLSYAIAMADKKDQLEKLLEEYNYPGKAKFLRIVKDTYGGVITRQDVVDFLKKDTVTQQYQATKKKKASGHITAMETNELWNVDIFDMSAYEKGNEGYKYMLACVDVFSRRAYTEKMKTKDSIAAREAFEKVLTRLKGEKPRSILIDNDAGFLSEDNRAGETFAEMLEKKGIALQTNALKDHKAMGIIDNFAKRIHEIMNKQKLRDKSIDWINKMRAVETRYNKDVHKGLGDIAPNDVEKPENHEKVLELNIEKDQGNITKTDLVAGDKVRVNVLKNNANAKGTDPKWSGKVFTVYSSVGQTITLTDDSRHKRHDLLKVATDAEDIPENVIRATRKANAKETKQLNAKNPDRLARKQRILAALKKRRADHKEKQAMEAADAVTAAEAEKQAQKDREQAELDKMTPEQVRQLKKEQQFWIHKTNTGHPPTDPYPWTLKHLEDILKKRAERQAEIARKEAAKAAAKRMIEQAKADRERAAAAAKAAKAAARGR
jgi:Integrase core domain